MEAKDIVKNAVVSLDKHKAADIKIIGVTDITSLADYFIIAEGTSSTQVKALSDYVEFELGRAGNKAPAVEGYNASNWILMGLRHRNPPCVSGGDPSVLRSGTAVGRAGSSFCLKNSSASRKPTESTRRFFPIVSMGQPPF